MINIESYDYEGLIRSFIEQDRPYASTAQNRMSYRDNRLYSYNAEIARIDKDKKVILIDDTYRGYSNTTSRHLQKLYMNIPYKYKVFYIDFDNPSLKHYWDKIHENITLFTRARLHKDLYATEAKTLYKEALEYADYAKIDKRIKEYKEHKRIFAKMFKYKILRNDP